MNDTPTPRTDEATLLATDIEQGGNFNAVHVQVAQRLERELTAAREEIKAVTEQRDEMTLRWELTNDSLFDKRALADRLAEAMRKIQEHRLVSVDAFDELDRIDEIVDEALQSLKQPNQ